MAEFIPIRPRRKTVKNRWFDKELRCARNKVNRLRKKYKAHSNASGKLILKKARSEFKKLHRLKFRQYINGVEQKIIEEPKNFWSFINSKRGTLGYPRFMKLLDHESECTQDITEMFSTFFSSNFLPPSTNLTVEGSDNVHPDFGNLGSIRLSVDLIFEYLSNLKHNQSPGPDSVPAVILRKCAQSLAIPFELLFNRSLEVGYFPDCWKTSHVIPIHKNGDRSLVDNYRPISILSATPKFFECMVRDIMIKEFGKFIIQQQWIFYRSVNQN